MNRVSQDKSGLMEKLNEATDRKYFLSYLAFAAHHFQVFLFLPCQHS